METFVLFSGGPWDGQELPVTLEGDRLPPVWHMIEDRPTTLDLADTLTDPIGARMGSGREQIRHEYVRTIDPMGLSVYVHEDERPW